MTKWPPFLYREQVYDLSHLDGFTCEYLKPAQDGKPAVTYRVFVHFGHHCFTEKKKPGDDPALEYRHVTNRDYRSFDTLRYELSRQLPALVRDLMGRKCFHTGHGNSFTIEVTSREGEQVEYEVYFKPYKEQGSRQLRLIVESAFPRDADRLENRPRTKPVKFEFLLYNTQMNRPVKVQR
ncbi:conserved hypothetical protein [Deinococcus aerius]|uniref:Heat shock protein C n=1 Tax=Deinococcus aerius TaxID=200253 RepID=A0A2I9DIH4_9DEIO|nr:MULTISPECIES: hypothetical protein [Deinococcus]GBF04531.1 conserved hypothetical protein [Deinococcus aerius]